MQRKQNISSVNKYILHKFLILTKVEKYRLEKNKKIYTRDDSKENLNLWYRNNIMNSMLVMHENHLFDP